MLSREHAFRYFIKNVEIEISAACNRRCDYCPQSSLSRRQSLLPLQTFENIINELAALQYTGTLAFHQYNEPLLVPDHLFACLAIARKKLPRCPCLLFTNGDYLTTELLDKLAENGILKINMTCHVDRGTQYDFEKMIGKIVLKSQQLRLPLQLAGGENNIASITKYKNMHITIRSTNFTETGSDRLKSVIAGTKNMISPDRNICNHLFHCLHVTYKGNIPLCCDCCEDTDAAKPYVLGNINEASLIDIFENKLKNIQSYMFGDLPLCCHTCRGYC